MKFENEGKEIYFAFPLSTSTFDINYGKVAKWLECGLE